MPKPYEFKNTKELVKALKKEKKVLGKWFNRRVSNLTSIVYESVGTNTFRAFHHMPLPPSDVYREWAIKKLNHKQVIKGITTITSEQQYDAWIKNLSRNFLRYWEGKMGSGNTMAYGPSRKLPNLLMKAFVLWEGIDDTTRRTLIEYLHVPLDSFSLVGIRHCAKEYPDKIGRSIPCSATMSFVTDDQTYNSIQQTIREIARRADVPPVYFDVLAWNKAH
jgi:hypothetical protein